MKDTVTKTLPKSGQQKSLRRGAPQLRILFSPSYKARPIFSLLKGTTEIGREEKDDRIALPDDSGMSKLHACIKVSETDGLVFLRDQSKNGTFVGDL
ncbi:MAG TPA: FHA domain-containing protein, partial [Pseudomonadota bacterium]|nr:FHA domain-containing protein [Pseudomonadota bacterium]